MEIEIRNLCGYGDEMQCSFSDKVFNNQISSGGKGEGPRGRDDSS